MDPAWNTYINIPSKVSECYKGYSFELVVTVTNPKNSEVKAKEFKQVISFTETSGQRISDVWDEYYYTSRDMDLYIDYYADFSTCGSESQYDKLRGAGLQCKFYKETSTAGVYETTSIATIEYSLSVISWLMPSM